MSWKYARCNGLHLVVTGGTSDAPELFRIDGQRVLTILLQHRQRLLVVDLPHPVRISRNPNFGEGDQLAPTLSGLLDEGYGLLDASLKVEPARLGRDGGSLVLSKRHVECMNRFEKCRSCSNELVRCDVMGDAVAHLAEPGAELYTAAAAFMRYFPVVSRHTTGELTSIFAIM